MKGICLTFDTPPDANRISLIDLRLKPGGIAVSYFDLLHGPKTLSETCAHGYAKSIKSCGLDVKFCTSAASGIMMSSLIEDFDDGLFFGVLSGAPGPHGYHIDFYELPKAA